MITKMMPTSAFQDTLDMAIRCSPDSSPFRKSPGGCNFQRVVYYYPQTLFQSPEGQHLRKKCAPKVGFRPRVSVREVPPLSAYTKDHLHELYFTRNDYRIIRAKLHHQVKAIEASSSMEEDNEGTELCRRGLESALCSTKNIRRDRVQVARSAVLNEQRRQRERGQRNDLALSRAYNAHTMISAYRALDQAGIDACEASEYLFPADNR